LRRLDLGHRFDTNDWFLRRRIRYRAVDECGGDTLSTWTRSIAVQSSSARDHRGDAPVKGTMNVACPLWTRRPGESAMGQVAESPFRAVKRKPRTSASLEHDRQQRVGYGPSLRGDERLLRRVTGRSVQARQLTLSANSGSSLAEFLTSGMAGLTAQRP
jgi:hypothetical protein